MTRTSPATTLLLLGLLNVLPHMVDALNLSSLSVPRIIDVAQRAKLYCDYQMGNRTLNSVKWYKDGQEFYRYSPLTPPTTNWFPVKGVTIAASSSHCNQFVCTVELENLNVHSSGQYRCEVSGDAPEFKLIDKSGNMTVAVLPKHNPDIDIMRPTYKYGDNLIANCSADWSNPAPKLTWYINNKTAPQHSLLPQINESTRNKDGILLYSTRLQLRHHINDERFIRKSEMLELRCRAEIMGLDSVRRESHVRVTVLAQNDSGNNARLMDSGVRDKEAWLFGLLAALFWHWALS